MVAYEVTLNKDTGEQVQFRSLWYFCEPRAGDTYGAEASEQAHMIGA